MKSSEIHPARRRAFVSIATTSYSGATLLCFLLGTHPEIATVGEMDGIIPSEDPDTYKCSCGVKVRSCPFWRSVADGMSARGHSFDVARFLMRFELGGPRLMRGLRVARMGDSRIMAARDRLVQSLPWERGRWAALVARNEAFIEVILDVSGKRLLVDSSKDPLRLLGLERRSHLAVRAIHLIRDARGVASSRLRRGVPISAREAARQWARSHERVEATMRTLPEGAWLRVRYEDLCDDPDGVLGEIHRFLGVASVPLPESIDLSAQHVVGNQMRLAGRTAIVSDVRWRTELSPSERRVIEAVAGRVMTRYGYG